MNISDFYNKYHKKNRNIQDSIISDDNYTYQYLIDLINKYFSKPGKILDIGCGVGTIDFFLSKTHKLILGIDISDDAIKLGNKSLKKMKISNVNLISGNIDEGVIDHKNYFDYCICSEVIEHVKNDDLLIKQVYKSLKKDGIAIFSTPSINAPLYKIGLLDSFDMDVGHLRRYSKDDLIELFKNNKFSIVEIKKTEGLLRNALFTNKTLGNFVRFIKWPVTPIINLLDCLLMRIFGESNYYFVVKK